MSLDNPQQEVGHSGTFEVAPPQEVRGEKVQLVYTRVNDPATEEDLRIHALRMALDVERFIFRKDEDSDPAAIALATAERFLGFLKGGAR